MQNNFFKRAAKYISEHKVRTVLICIIIIIAGYYGHKALTNTSGDTTYVLGTVQKNTIVASISGSGQVSTARTLDLKPQASGNVVYVGAKPGSKVVTGQLIAELDASTAQKAVRDAEANLESAKISMQKIQEPTDALSLLQAQNAVTQATNDLAASYTNGYNSVSGAFLDLPSTIEGLDSILHGMDANPSSGQQNEIYYSDSTRQLEVSGINAGKARQYETDAEQKYQAAKKAYDTNFSDYKNTSSASNTATISSIIDETYATSQLLDDALKAAANSIQYYQDITTATGGTPIAKSNTQLSTLLGYVSKTDGNTSSLLSSKNSIISNAASLPEKQASLQKLQAGTDPLDIQSSQLSLQRAENSLQDAKDTLENYFVRAPFSGTIATVPVKVGDPAGSGTAVATLIANDDVVDIPLNEVDVSKVNLGDKVTLTFDAVDGLTLTGKVASIDTVGTVTQGVVNYTVTISFDSIDPRVKPGMSTTASVITDVHSDVLSVPGSAVKTTAAGSYVQVFDPIPTTTDVSGNIISKTAPTEIPVTVGISDDTNTEIVSGLTEGEKIVVRSITSSAAKPATPTAPSLLGGGARGGAAGGGNATFRAVGR